MRRIGPCAAVALSMLAPACHRTTHYETDVEVTRASVVKKDGAGKPQLLDLEIAYVDCPGEQTEVIRGGPELAACASGLHVGSKVKVSIDHEWSREGFYRSVVRRIGDCGRSVDPDDEASFVVARECSAWTVNGNQVGFNCNYEPEKKLIEKCPWFRRR